MKEIAVFGGGCFWCTEAVFKMLRGVTSIRPGYTGGKTPHPTYEEVSRGDSGHVEVIHIEYDAEEIPYKDLLTVFFASHDGSQLNRQGNDIGEQYRSVIFYTTNAQQKEAETFIEALNVSHVDGDPIVTTVEPLGAFYDAEGYHKDYFKQNPEAAYCQLVINPKLEKVQEEFATLLNANEAHHGRKKL